MLSNLKSLVVIWGIALVVFHFAKPLALRYMSSAVFSFRRNLWLGLTTLAFICPSFWIFSPIAIGILLWAVRRDPNPLALYLLVLHIIPPISLYIPVVGVNNLFDLNNFRILALGVLLPTALGPMRSEPRPSGTSLRSIDTLVILYCLLQLALFIPYESVTNTMRRGFLLALDVLLLYYVFSRAATKREQINEAMATFTLTCAVHAIIAIFESTKGWLLYQTLGGAWDVLDGQSWLLRGNTLRAQASAGHALTLGYLLSMGFGFWLHLADRFESKTTRLAGALCMWIGLIGSYSRAPWLTAVLVFFLYLAMSPRGTAKVVKAGLWLAALSALVLISPLGDRILDNLPFVGTVDEGNVLYRQRLAEVSWSLIQQNPFFGDPFFMNNMEELRQGQGIIDLVNGYAAIALASGLVGLSLFVGFFAMAMLSAFGAARRAAASGSTDDEMLGACLVACLLGTLFMIATGGFGAGLAQMAWVLAGFCVSYSRLGSAMNGVKSPPAVRQQFPRDWPVGSRGR
ncbi:MAG TPA: O-antigen ligase family protein [Roseateles sp.]